MYNSISGPLGHVSAVSPRFAWTFDIRDSNNTKHRNQDCKDLGNYVESPNYLTTIGSRTIEWCLRFYRDGEDEACKGYCSIYLCASDRFTAIVGFEIVNMRDESNYRKERYVLNEMSCGFRKFILKSTLRESTSNMLVNNKVTILCGVTLLNYGVPGIMYQVTILDEAADEFMATEEEDDLQSQVANERMVVEDVITPIQLEVIDRFKSLINDEKYSDLEIRANGEIIKVHKCIMERSSRTVRTLLELNGSRSFVEIEDIRHEALVESIAFAYTGTMDDSVEKINRMPGELLNAAEKLGMDGMKRLCEKLMCENLRRANVISYLELAERHGLGELRAKASRLFAMKDIVDEPEFRELACAVYYSLTHGRQPIN